MSGMRIAVVDDDPACAAQMMSLIDDFSRKGRYPLKAVSFPDAESFLKEAENSSFAAVFMDIFMQGLDGITAAQRLREKDNRCFLIFLTSSHEFMPDAFSCHAFEYITKPVTAERVQAVLTDMLKFLPSAHPYFELRSDRQNLRIFCDDVISVISDAHYLNIALTDGQTVRTRMTIKEFLALVKEDPRFLVINKGIVVNADRIVEFDGNSCQLENGIYLPVRVRGRAQIAQAARDYTFGKIRSGQIRKRG